MELLSTQNLQPLSVLSAGVLAGVGITISFVAAPAALASKDPLRTWREIYKRGSKIALSSIAFTSAASITCYLNNRRQFGKEDSAFLFVAGATMLIPPFTLIFMKPINDELFRIDENTPVEEVKDLVAQWSNFQWVRTALKVGAFIGAVYNYGRK